MKPLEYSHVFVIESLRPGDASTGTSLYNDTIRPRMMQKGLEAQCELISVQTKLECFAALEKIRQLEIHQLANPVIHLEMHGDENGLQLTSNESISWQEIQFYLLQLNGICGNNLFVSMATCKGGYIHKAIHPGMWAPFWGFMGPFEVVTGGEILANYSAFYDEFLQSGDFNAAVTALHAVNPQGYTRFRFHNTAYLFNKAYTNYESLYLTPEIIDQRVEAIFAQCRPLPDFDTWNDQKIRNYARNIIVDDGGVIKKKMTRKFFMLDQFPGDVQYYEGLL